SESRGFPSGRSNSIPGESSIVVRVPLRLDQAASERITEAARPMNLPDYFLADLPAEAALTAAMVTDACHTLKRNRDHYLASRSTESLIHTIATLAENWRQP